MAENELSQYTMRLFRARPSFMDGYSEMLDFSSQSTRYNIDETEDVADAKALYADWRAVGQDIMDAVEKVKYA